MADEHKEMSRMLGDFLREGAVLVFIFFPLEIYLKGNLEWSTMAWDVVLSGPLLYWGMILEGRKDEI